MCLQVIDEQEHWGIDAMPLPVQKMLAEFIGMTLFVFLVTSTQPCHTSALLLVFAYWYDRVLVGYMQSSIFALSTYSYSLCCLQGPSSAINGGDTLQIALTFGFAIFVSSQPPRAASPSHRCVYFAVCVTVCLTVGACRFLRVLLVTPLEAK